MEELEHDEPMIMTYTIFTDVDNDHIALQLFYDYGFNAMDLIMNLYPSNPREDMPDRREPESWDNYKYLIEELYPALEEHFRTGKVNRVVYELGEEFTPEEIHSMFHVFIRCFEFIELFQLDLSTLDGEGECTCPNCRTE